MPTTPAQGLPYPGLSDPANLPANMQSLALAVEPKLVQVYSSLSARNTALPSPPQGILTYLTAEKRWEGYDGAWRVVADYATGNLYSLNSDDDGGSVSTANTWTTTATGSGKTSFTVTMVAPPSGRVLVMIGQAMHISAATAYPAIFRCGLRINGPGQVNIDPADNHSLLVNIPGSTMVNQSLTLSRTYVHKDLTPGSSYTWTWVGKTNATTCTGFADDRRIELLPVIT